MAYSPGYSGLLNAAFPRIGQHEASSGRRINKQVVQGLLQADLDRSKQFAMSENFRNRQLEQQADQFNRQLDIQKQGQVVGGAGQLLQLPLAYGAAKSAGLLPKGFQLTSPSTWGGAATTGGAVAPAAATAQGAVAPAVAGATAQGGLLTGGAASTGAGTIAPSAAGTAGAAGAEAGLLSTAGSVALPAAAASYVGGRLGGKVAEALGTHEKTTRDVMSVGSGALVGFAVGGPIGAVVGAAIGLVSSLF